MNEKIYCSVCGELTESGKFCQSCGAHLGKEEIKIEQPIQPQPQTIVVQQPQYVVKETNTMADASLVFAILGFTCLPFIGGIIAMILGFIALMNPYKRRQATTALVLGFMSVCVIPLVFVLLFTIR